MKQLYFVSTGRCGTKRIAEILRDHLPFDKFDVQHQMNVSRTANMLGNIMYYMGEWEWLKRSIYHKIRKKYIHEEKHFISSDPLISMTLPDEVIKDTNVYIVHIIREQEEFANSFYNFTRKKMASFIAHNFIPFWQIGVWPLENILNRKIKNKYEKVWQKKNDWITDRYGLSPNYAQVDFKSILTNDTLSALIKKVFDQSVNISKETLAERSNESFLS